MGVKGPVLICISADSEIVVLTEARISKLEPKIDRAGISQVLEQNFAGEWDIFTATAASFIENVDLSVRDLEVVFKAGEIEKIMRIAHRLKGETSLFHDLTASNLFKAMELTSKSGQMPDADILMQAKHAVDQLVVDLKHLLA